MASPLGCGIRSHLRQPGHSMYDDVLLKAEEEQQQRKAMQQLRLQVQQQVCARAGRGPPCCAGSAAVQSASVATERRCHRCHLELLACWCYG
jgi:hypothetical protein